MIREYALCPLYCAGQDRPLGRLHGERAFTIPKQSCLVLGIREDAGRPQVLSTNRHITQEAEDLLDVEWHAGSQTLTGASEVVGGDDYVLTLQVPKGFEPESVRADQGEVTLSAPADGEVMRVIIRAPENARISWKARFKSVGP